MNKTVCPYNSVTATRKINELTEEIKKLNEKLNNNQESTQ